MTQCFILIKAAQSGSYQALTGTWGSQSPWIETSRGLQRDAPFQETLWTYWGRSYKQSILDWCFLNTSRNILPLVCEMTTEGIHGNAVGGNSRRQQSGVYYWECGQVQISGFSHCCDRSSNKGKLMEEGCILAHTSRGDSPS